MISKSFRYTLWRESSLSKQNPSPEWPISWMPLFNFDKSAAAGFRNFFRSDNFRGTPERAG